MLQIINRSRYRALQQTTTPFVLCIENIKDPTSMNIVSLMTKLGDEYEDILCYKISWLEYNRIYKQAKPSETHKVKFYKDNNFWYEKICPKEEELV